MANKNILTYGATTSSVQQMYYLPVASIPPYTNPNYASIYCFLAKADPWDDNNNPPAPTQDQKALKQVFKNIFAVKKISSNEISPVIIRKDWSANTVYDYYKDDVDMFEQDQNGFLVRNFYIKNRYDQVFKCLWNNNDSSSTDEPYFQPGSYGTNNIFTGTDGYKWKYIYTISAGDKIKFMDSTWIPISLSVSKTPNPLRSTSGYGSIDVINVLDGGSGYNPSNTVITVSIVGDGTGAAAAAVTTNNSITSITVTNSGKNYTYANASIISTEGAGAILESPVSPVGGHGFDPLTELGCRHVMLISEFNGSESGTIPTDIDFHQVGVIMNPTTKELSPLTANGTVYKTTTDLVVSPGLGVYTNDELIYQGSDLENASFVGRVLSFDPGTNVIRTINTKGSLVTNLAVYGNTSKTVRTLFGYTEPTFTLFSGNIAFIENRASIQRSSDGIEQFKLVLGY